MKTPIVKSLTWNEWQGLKQSELVQAFSYLKGFEIKQDFFERFCIRVMYLEDELIGVMTFCSIHDDDFAGYVKDLCFRTYDEDVLKIWEGVKHDLNAYQNAIEINLFSIRDDYQGLGYGTWWINQLKAEFNQLVLYMGMDSEPFWEKQEFEEILLDYVGWSAA